MLADFSLVVTPWGGSEEGSSAAQAGVKAKGEQPCVSGRSSGSGYRRPGSRRRGCVSWMFSVSETANENRSGGYVIGALKFQAAAFVAGELTAGCDDRGSDEFGFPSP